MSLINLVLIPTFVSALNSTIVFRFFTRFQQCMASLCSRFIWVGTYLPIPAPSNKIALPTQKLTHELLYPKLTTYALPYPKTHQQHGVVSQRSCVTTGSAVGIYSRNRMVIWRLVSDCTKKTSEHNAA